MIKFEGGKTRTLKEEFEERKEYKDYEGFKLFRTIDTHYVDLRYGMMNREYEPIVIISEQDNVSLMNFPDLADNVSVLPFVAMAFNDFREEYTSFIQNATDPAMAYPKHIEGIIPAKGYVNFAKEFAGYANYNMEMHKKQLGIDPEIKTFDIFMEKFFEIFEEKGPEYPITKSGFTTSDHCSIMTSGLCIELAAREYDFDEPKGEMITTSDFRCFADYANSYGFLVDKYVPWRLVADLNSERMREYIVRGRNLRTSRAVDLYESIYTTKSHYDDLYLLRNYLFSIYYAMHRNSPGTIDPIPPMPISRHVEIFLKVRCIELGIYDQNFGILKQKVLDIFAQYGLRYTQGYIGQLASDKLKKTYGP
jgi:hypothetical protein